MERKDRKEEGGGSSGAQPGSAQPFLSSSPNEAEAPLPHADRNPDTGESLALGTWCPKQEAKPHQLLLEQS